jgi:hypothetical protein
MTEDRTRADRTTEETAQRRRRDDTNIDGGKRLKLAIPARVQAELDAAGRQGRWVLADSDRMYALTEQDDYDRVDGVEPVTTRRLNDGSPVNMVLLSKPKAFIAEDKAKLEELRAGKEKAQLTGSDLAPGVYVDGAAEIKHGERRRSS